MIDNIHSISHSTQLAYLVLKNALNLYQKNPHELDATQRAAVVKQARVQYDIESKVLSSSYAQQIQLEPSQIDAALTQVKNRYPDEQTFIQDLAQHGMTPDNFYQALSRELTVETIFDTIGAASSELISEVDAQIYYYLHPNQFQQPEKRTVRHILITINEELAENTREAAKNRLTKIANTLQHHPQQFIEQAKKFSECPSALEGGLIGSIPRGKLYPQLDEVLFSMRQNHISDLVESPMGFHLLWCEKIIKARLIPFAQIKEQLLKQLKTRYQRIAQKQWLSKL